MAMTTICMASWDSWFIPCMFLWNSMFEGESCMFRLGTSVERACVIRRFVLVQKSVAMRQSMKRCRVVSLWLLQLLQESEGRTG